MLVRPVERRLPWPAALRGRRWQTVPYLPTGAAAGLPYLPLSAGLSRETTRSYDWQGRRRGTTEFVLFQYTVAGEGRLALGGQEHVVRPGQAMVLGIPGDHRYWLPASATVAAGGTGWEFFYVTVGGPETMRAWARIEAALPALVTWAAEAGPVRAAAELAEAQLREGAVSPYEVSALGYALLMELARAAHPVRANAEDGAGGAVAAVQREVEARLHEAWTVEAMARAAGWSRFHFSRRFAEQVGVSPAAWLTGLRVREAAHWLRAGDLPLKAIAERCGFADVNYFGKVFRQHTGTSPGAFRRRGV